jgi:hypothetical protein
MKKVVMNEVVKVVVTIMVEMMIMAMMMVSRIERLTLTPSDPFVVVVLSLSFIASIFFLHIAAKIVRVFTK